MQHDIDTDNASRQCVIYAINYTSDSVIQVSMSQYSS